MDKDRLLTGAVIFILALLPLAGIVYAGHASKPKERKITLRDTYPDEHFFI